MEIALQLHFCGFQLCNIIIVGETLTQASGQAVFLGLKANV